MMQYRLRPRFPSVDDYLRLRHVAGLSPRSREGARIGLANTLFGVTASCNDEVVGMGRIIGDGGCFMQVVDIAVEPRHQRRGVGSRIVEMLMAYLKAHAPAGSYISLIAEPGLAAFYRRFGFELCAPSGDAMCLRVPMAGIQNGERGDNVGESSHYNRPAQ